MPEYNIFEINPAFVLKVDKYAFKGEFPDPEQELVIEQRTVKYFRENGTEPGDVSDDVRAFIWLSKTLNETIQEYPKGWPLDQATAGEGKGKPPGPRFRWEKFRNTEFTLAVYKEYERKRTRYLRTLKKNKRPGQRAKAADRKQSPDAIPDEGIPRLEATRE